MLTAPGSTAIGLGQSPCRSSHSHVHRISGSRKRLSCTASVEGRTARTANFSGAPAELKRMLQSPGIHLVR